MTVITKEITKGASIYGQTKARGDLEDVRRMGCMPCASGDDHILTNVERALVRAHDPDKGDLELPPGPLSYRRNATPIE